MTVENSIINDINLCACGQCGQKVTGKYWSTKNHCWVQRQFVKGHNSKGSGNPAWNGGRVLIEGYWYVWKPNHPYRNARGYVAEHRLVVEAREGRYLTRKEEVHHINGIRTDNRSENLMLFASVKEHRKYERIGVKFGKRVDTNNRFCLFCGGKTRINKKGIECWYRYQDVFICMSCYYKQKYKNNK